MSSAVVERPVEIEAERAPRNDDRPASRPPAPQVQRSRGRSAAIQIVSALVLLVALLFGFGVYLFGLSHLSEQRAQDTLRKNFTHELSQAIAPVGPTALGSPMAVLDIPQIGLRDAVVVEGTGARQLANGPGHAVGSVYPGQSGTSVVYARRATFGAPFAHLMRLERGDIIRVTTGQGVARYRVSSFGDIDHPAPANSTNRLVLVTSGGWLLTDTFVTVSADLIGGGQPTSGQVGMTTAEQLPLARDVSGSLLPTLLWSQALLAVAVLGVVAFVRWKPAAAYLCVVPVALAVLWNLYENLALLGPNLY